MKEILVLLSVGFGAGLLSGFLGIGGGIIVVPLLVIILGYSQHAAQGTSLAFLLMPIGILAVMNYYKAGNVNIKAALIMAITFLVGSFISSKIVVSIDEMYLKKGFAIFLIIYAVKLLFFDK